jgi:hypothetical protein
MYQIILKKEAKKFIDKLPLNEKKIDSYCAYNNIISSFPIIPLH